RLLLMSPLSTSAHHPHLPSFPTRRSSDLATQHARRDPAGRERLLEHRRLRVSPVQHRDVGGRLPRRDACRDGRSDAVGLLAFARSEEHTSELQSRENLVCRLLLEKKKDKA